MHNHKHLPKRCYQETEAVEFAVFDNPSDMFIYEVYFINKWLPKYNRSMRGTGTSIRMKGPVWITYGNPFKDQVASNRKINPIKGYRLISDADGSVLEFKHKYQLIERLNNFTKSEVKKLFMGQEIQGLRVEKIR